MLAPLLCTAILVFLEHLLPALAVARYYAAAAYQRGYDPLSSRCVTAMAQAQGDVVSGRVRA